MNLQHFLDKILGRQESAEKHQDTVLRNQAAILTKLKEIEDVMTALQTAVQQAFTNWNTYQGSNPTSNEAAVVDNALALKNLTTLNAAIAAGTQAPAPATS